MKLLSLLSDKWRRPLGSAAAIVIYLGAAYVIVGRGLLGDFTGRIVSISSGHDPSQMIWFLAWFPHAIANHLDPFYTRAVWWPGGINLAWVTSIPGAAILSWPITSAFGPVASFNTLSFLALPAAAFSAFLLCRDLTGHNRASIVAGYVFGFSPYFLGHLQTHLVLILAFPIPLTGLLMTRLLQGRVRMRIFVPLMALMIALQIGFSLELFATMTAVGIIALALGFAIGPEAWRLAIRNVMRPLTASFAIAALLVAPYWYYLFAFEMPKGSIISPAGVSIDLLNFLVPTDTNLFGLNSIFENLATRFGFRSEAGGWIAWPLLVVIALYLRSQWRKPLGKVLTVMVLLLALATLGPRLRVGGHSLIGLPWKLVEHLPLLKSALPARLTIFVFLIVAVMTACVLARPDLSRIAKYALALAIPVCMLPNLDYRFWTSPIDLPEFFATGQYAQLLQREETVVILPYVNRGDSMLWQADADFYFRMAGGNTGPGMIDDFLKWPAANALYWGSALDDARTQLGAFFAAHDVRHVIVEEKRASEYLPVLADLHDLSGKATHLGGVIVFPIERDQIEPYRDLKSIDLETMYARDRFDRLVVAANRYLSAGADGASLTPSRVARLGLLPSSWAVDSDVYTKDGLILGPWKGDRIQVGVVGSYDALKPLIASYRSAAREIYFPFPRPLSEPPAGNTFMRKLVVIFDRSGLAQAAQLAELELASRASPTAPR